MVDPLTILTTIANPKEWLEAISTGVRAWRGVSVLAFGTTRVGKSTLWKYLETGKPAHPETISRTMEVTPVGDGKFRLHNVSVYGIKVALKGLDVPGHLEMRSVWKDVLQLTKPRAIVFMLDHATDSGPDGSITAPDPERLREHHEAFEYLRDLILNDAEVCKNLRALLFLANKSDVWPREVSYHQLLRQSRIPSLYDRLQEIKHLTIRANHCSALYGTNVQEEIRWIVQNTGG